MGIPNVIKPNVDDGINLDSAYSEDDLGIFESGFFGWFHFSLHLDFQFTSCIVSILYRYMSLYCHSELVIVIHIPSFCCPDISYAFWFHVLTFHSDSKFYCAGNLTYAEILVSLQPTEPFPVLKSCVLFLFYQLGLRQLYCALHSISKPKVHELISSQFT